MTPYGPVDLRPAWPALIVAITGVVLIAFVVGHLLGNLQIFLGPDWINSYAEHLRELGPLLWVIRAFLLLNVLLHIFFTISLALENRRARLCPERTLYLAHAAYQRGFLFSP